MGDLLQMAVFGVFRGLRKMIENLGNFPENPLDVLTKTSNYVLTRTGKARTQNTKMLKTKEKTMTKKDLKATNRTIETVVNAIRLMEQQETAFYNYLADNVDAIDATFLQKQVESSIEIVTENTKLLKTICETKASGLLRLLNEKPYRIAILRLNAAVLQAQAALGKDTNPVN